MNNREIHLTLNIDEINKMLTALGNLPYAQVFSLIDKIRNQAEVQVENQVNSNQQKIKADK